MTRRPPPGSSKPAAQPPVRWFFVIAFIEGATVMAIELAGAKMIAPYYGSSLYVWAAVLSVTLGGLTGGYFLGGRLVSRHPRGSLLVTVLAIGTVLTATMPVLATAAMPATNGLGVRMGSLVSALCFMLLPLVCMGMVSPILIQLATHQLKDAGKTAGSIYAISTVGGILMTLAMGFYLLPEWGIHKSIGLTASLLGLAPLLYLALARRAGTTLLAGGGYVALVLLVFAPTGAAAENGLSHIRYRSEGVLGQLTVLDYLQTDTNRMFRMLLLNEIPQTHVTLNFMPISAWSYPHRLATLASVAPAHGKALLIGMGGGSVAMELKRMGFDLDVVEIDRRIPRVARDYFRFDGDGVHVAIDDGRHYLRTCDRRYDVVIIDVLNGEAQPFQLFTREAFGELRRVLAPGGLVLINYQGYVTGPLGRSARSIYKTLLASGFRVKYQTTSTPTAEGDVTLIASLVEHDFHAIDVHRLNLCCQSMEFGYSGLVTEQPLDLGDAYVLTDDQPRLETLAATWNEEWRRKAMLQYAARGVALFE